MNQLERRTRPNLRVPLTGNEHSANIVAIYCRLVAQNNSRVQNALADSLKHKQAALNHLGVRLQTAMIRVEQVYSDAFLRNVIKLSRPLLAQAKRVAIVPENRADPGRDKLVTAAFAESSQLSLYVLGCAARAETAVRMWLIDRLGLCQAQVEDTSASNQFALYDLVVRQCGVEILIDVKNNCDPQKGAAYVKNLQGRHSQNIVFMGARVRDPCGEAIILGQLSKQDAHEITLVFSKVEKAFYGYDSIQSAAENGKVCAWLFSLTGDILPDQFEEERRGLSALTERYPSLDLLRKKPAFDTEDVHLRTLVPWAVAANLDGPSDVIALQDHFRQRLNEIGCIRPRLFHIYLLTIEHFLFHCVEALAFPSEFPPYICAFCGSNGTVSGNYDPCRSYADLVQALNLLWDVGPRDLKIEKLTVLENGTIVANYHHDSKTEKFPRHTVYTHCRHCRRELVFGREELNEDGYLVCKTCTSFLHNE